MGSVLERLDIDVQIPYDEEALLSGDPKRLTKYIRELVKKLREILEEVVTITNYGIDLNDGEYIYFGLKGFDGDCENGVWRRGRDGDNLIEQVKISGTWTTVHTRERPV